LSVFTVATLTFWPSSSLLSFPGFVVSNILIGSGLSIIQLAANPFIALAGPEELMECRLNFGQGLQAIGTLVSPLLAIKVLFKHISRAGLFRSQWLYLAVSLWSSLLGVIVYYVPLCEASNADLERVAWQRSRKGLSKHAKVCGIKIIPFVAFTGIFSIWLFIGAQEQLRYFWNSLMMEVKG
jgi:fucose permease